MKRFTIILFAAVLIALSACAERDEQSTVDNGQLTVTETTTETTTVGAGSSRPNTPPPEITTPPPEITTEPAITTVAITTGRINASPTTTTPPPPETTTVGANSVRPHTTPPITIGTTRFTSSSQAMAIIPRPTTTAPAITNVPPTATVSTTRFAGTTMNPGWTLTTAPIVGNLSPTALKIENMSDTEFVDAYANNKFPRSDIYEIDDFGVKYLDPVWGYIMGSKSAASRAAALKITEEFVADFSYKSISIDFLGENDYFYLYRWRYYYGYDSDTEEQEMRLIVFRENALSIQGNNSQKTYFINMLDKQSVTNLIDILFSTERWFLPTVMYRSVEETATQFIYTYYSVLDQSHGRTLVLTRGQHVVEKSTGEIITIKNHLMQTHSELKRVHNPYSPEILLLKCCEVEYLCYRSGATLCSRCQSPGVFVQVMW